MVVSPSYRTWIEETLGRVRPVRTRAMFGGLGIYAGDVFFALVDDDVLYFKVNDRTRPDFVARGMGPFRPYGPDDPPMKGYYQVPADVLESDEELETWMRRAIDVALTSRGRRGGRRGP